jgi:soluble lytic murein transglycosylase-like protein/tetratricopeptide (TPR) repeat protein
LSSATAWAGIEDLARSGKWERVIEVASRRIDQVPLGPEEAMIAAYAARALGDRGAEQQFLEIAVDGAGGELLALAEVQLAALLQPNESDRVLDLALPALDRSNPWQVRVAATNSASAAVAGGVDETRRARLEGTARKTPRSLRRQLELALALSDTERKRPRLVALLSASTRDLVALQAAEALLLAAEPAPKERWLAAKTLYRHALYGRAQPIFEDLEGADDSTIPGDELAFLRGRCAFRRDRWAEAVVWYGKALARARTADGRAGYEIHIGRTLELDGDLEGAVDAALRAVRLETTDERRMFLARLRLRRGEPDLAAQGIARLRGRGFRARGDIMLGVDALRRGEIESARRRLESIRRQPWMSQASVVAAGLAHAQGEPESAVELLERVATTLDGFWVQQARTLMGALPSAQVKEWRERRSQEVEKTAGRSRWLALGRWAALEPDSGEHEHIRERVAVEFEALGGEGEPTLGPSLARQLWDMGLESEGARWDPGAFPRGDAVASAWSATRMLEHRFPWRSTRIADGAWRQAGSEVPTCALPEGLRMALYPLPDPQLVRAAAARRGIDWSLLAAVAREESRWDPGAVSAVGARGLVQLMPATAAGVAERIGRAKPTGGDLFDPETSLDLGAAELARLLEVFDGRLGPVVAAYNAGEIQARLWLDQCGPACDDALYLLNISFSATRTYTADVLAAAVSYSDLYGGKQEVRSTPGTVSD